MNLRCETIKLTKLNRIQSQTNNKLKTCSVDWLIEWPIAYSFDWLIDWVTNSWLVRLIDWLIDQFLTRSVDWLIEWPIAYSFDWLIDWVIDSLLVWLVDWLIDQFLTRSLGWLIEWSIPYSFAWLIVSLQKNWNWRNRVYLYEIRNWRKEWIIEIRNQQENNVRKFLFHKRRNWWEWLNDNSLAEKPSWKKVAFAVGKRCTKRYFSYMGTASGATSFRMVSHSSSNTTGDFGADSTVTSFFTAGTGKVTAIFAVVDRVGFSSTTSGVFSFTATTASAGGAVVTLATFGCAGGRPGPRFGLRKNSIFIPKGFQFFQKPVANFFHSEREEILRKK